VLLWLVRSAVVALYPTVQREGRVLLGAADCGLDAFLPQFRKDAPLLVWVGTVLGAIVFHLTPILTVFIPLPAFLLPAPLRDKHAARITTTRFYFLRQAVLLAKLPGGLCWGAHPAVRAQLNLPPLDPDPGTWRQS
jgi:hypothetical protein